VNGLRQIRDEARALAEDATAGDDPATACPAQLIAWLATVLANRETGRATTAEEAPAA
jgi:hypothetical protein